MWLPEDIYKETVQAIANPNKDRNELSAVIAVRSILLKDNAGNLNQPTNCTDKLNPRINFCMDLKIIFLDLVVYSYHDCLTFYLD